MTCEPQFGRSKRRSCDLLLHEIDQVAGHGGRDERCVGAVVDDEVKDRGLPGFEVREGEFIDQKNRVFGRRWGTRVYRKEEEDLDGRQQACNPHAVIGKEDAAADVLQHEALACGHWRKDDIAHGVPSTGARMSLELHIRGATLFVHISNRDGRRYLGMCGRSTQVCKAGE